MAEYHDFQQPPPTELEPVPEAVFWTRQRILYAVIAIFLIIAFLTMILWPALLFWLQPPPPPSPTPVLPRV